MVHRNHAHNYHAWWGVQVVKKWGAEGIRQWRENIRKWCDVKGMSEVAGIDFFVFKWPLPARKYQKSRSPNICSRSDIIHSSFTHTSLLITVSRTRILSILFLSLFSDYRSLSIIVRFVSFLPSLKFKSSLLSLRCCPPIWVNISTARACPPRF